VRGRAEAEVAPREGMPIKFVRALAWSGPRPSAAGSGSSSTSPPARPRAVHRAVVQARIIVGTGGCPAPTMLAAAMLRRMGLLAARVCALTERGAEMNLLVGRLADRVFVSFPDTLAAFPANGTMAGAPLRRRIQNRSRSGAQRPTSGFPRGARGIRVRRLAGRADHQPRS
jgi:UDP-N-acetylglucosamine--N-acetylmuramyl-(pentapeptide) pyrophosphoryl-undecaprenol N-acetylglucosamine transferase